MCVVLGVAECCLGTGELLYLGWVLLVHVGVLCWVLLDTFGCCLGVVGFCCWGVAGAGDFNKR